MVLGAPSTHRLWAEFYSTTGQNLHIFQVLTSPQKSLRQIMLVIPFDGWEFQGCSHLSKVTQLTSSRSSESTPRIFHSTTHSLSRIEPQSPMSLQDPLIQKLHRGQYFNSDEVAKVTEHVQGKAFLCSCPIARITILTGISNPGAEEAWYGHYCLPAFRFWKDN